MHYEIRGHGIFLQWTVSEELFNEFERDAEWNGIAMTPDLARQLAAAVARIVPSDDAVRCAMVHAKHRGHNAMLIRNNGMWQTLKHEDNYIADQAVIVTAEGVTPQTKFESWEDLEVWATQSELNELRALLGGEPLL